MGILFDAVDDYVSVPFNPFVDLGSGNPFTISEWLYTKSVPGSFATIFESSGSVPRFYFMVAAATTLFIGLGDWFQITTGTTITLNAWQHVVTTYDGSNVKVYVNAGTPWDSGNIGSKVYKNSTSRIGLEIADTFPFDGIINDVAIWNVVLSISEISLIYNSKIKYLPLQIQPANIIGYWPMNNGQDGVSANGATIPDLSGNGKDGAGNDGANNTGLTWKAEEVLSYPVSPMMILEGNQFPIVDAGADKYVFHYGLAIPFSDATFSDDDGTVDHAYIDVNGGGFTEIAQGDYSTLQDAVQAYLVKFPTVGAITVTLKVEDDGGATSQDTMTMNVLTIDADDVIEINGIKYDVIDSVNWDREDHHLKIPVVKRV